MENKTTNKFSDQAIALAAKYGNKSSKCFGSSQEVSKSDISAVRRIIEGKPARVKSWENAALDFLNGKTKLESIDEYAAAAAAFDTSVISQGQMSPEGLRACLRALAVAAARSGLSLQELAQQDYEALASGVAKR